MFSTNSRSASYFGAGSVEVSPPEREGESGVRRLAVAKDALVTQPAPGVETIPDVVDHAARVHGSSRNALGWRDVLATHEERKGEKTWTYFELSDYKYIDYVQFRDAVSEVARAFVELGITADDVVDIFAETSANWQIVSHACALISTATATAYDTLGASGLAHSLKEPECVAIFTNPGLLKMLLSVLPDTPSVKYVFYDGEPSDDLIDKIRALRSSNPITPMHISALRSLGTSKPLSTLAPRRPSPSTTACIMYTSGSTGAPKGVLLTHANLVASVAAVHAVFGPHLPPGGRYVAYLPLAHVLEYMIELCALFGGITLGYARTRTLTDASVRRCAGDLPAFRPTIMLGVPAVWETVRKAVLGQVGKSRWPVRAAFGAALEVKRWVGPWVPGVNWVVDRTVLRSVRAAVGGEISFAVNGGAALSAETQEFFNLAVMPLCQGYGLTESCGMCAFLPPELLSIGPVGLPAPSVEIKLIDCPDLGYVAAPSSSSSDLPQGEILLRGPSVTAGYFKRPDLNEDESVFTKDGWFRTGDVGRWNADGTLSIVDRLKNLVKLQGGEYIALERLESVYKSCDLVANLCVHAAGDMTQPIAIVCPHEGNLRRALSDNPSDSSSSDLDPQNASLEDLCTSAPARTCVLAALTALAKKNGFAKMETLSGVILASEEWTPQNGYVTAAQKVQRGKVREAFKGEIEECVKKQKGGK